LYKEPNKKKLYATVGVVANLLLLLFFKYSPLAARTFFQEGDALGELLLTIPLPIGISFYTFQGISLLVDVYRGEGPRREEMVPVTFGEHFRNSYLFIAFFPQLVAGPIVKAREFIPQIQPKLLRDIDWEFCFRNLVVGYFLKLVVADNLKEFTFWIEYPFFMAYKPVDLFMLLIGYSCQIFADFAGYSSIAIGLAGLFGYYLNINFNFPYLAGSFKDFWKRWHISLSSFLMEYLYLPLGGNRKGKARTYLNLLIVMALGGLWHGAAWSYLVWGLVHGVLLGAERFFFELTGRNLNTQRNVLYSAFVFLMVTFAWLFFRLKFTYVLLYFQAMFTITSFSFDTSLFLHIAVYSLPVVLYHMHGALRERQVLFRRHQYDYALYSAMLFLIFFNSGSSGTFIYFQF
jgi:alginate O-acetyltransferase complex protein AlgI